MLPLYYEKIYEQYELFATFLQSIKLTLQGKPLSISNPTYFKAYLLLRIYESYKDFIYDSARIWKAIKLDKECMYKILELFRNGDRLFFYNISGITNITLHSNEMEKNKLLGRSRYIVKYSQ